MLKCLECNNPGRWHVWYKGFGVAIGDPPANIAYNTFCDEHAQKEMVEGREGYHVACIKLIGNALLPEGDRAKDER